MNNKIIAIPSEQGMRFFLYNENKISWGSTGFIIPFLRKSNLSALLPTSSSKLQGSKFSTGAAFRGVPLSPPAKTGLVASTSRRRLIELAGLERLLAVQIVDLALVSVAEHVIGLGYLLELGLRLLLVLPVLIRMPLHRQTLVRSLQIFIGSVLRDFQYVIVINTHFPFPVLTIQSKRSTQFGFVTSCLYESEKLEFEKVLEGLIKMKDGGRNSGE
nr:hypothetical protein Iba_chr07dCG11470 [Ipomoea batatas]